ncbi:MAG: hypothetical protein ABUL57_03395 [Chloroflexota bacterium]
MTRPDARLLPVLAALALAVAGCTIGEVEILGGGERCWDDADQRVASLMKGTLDVGGANPTLTTPEGEVLALRLPRFDLGSDGTAATLKDPGGGAVLAADGDLVTLFGGLGSDGSMYVCRVDERNAAP